MQESDNLEIRSNTILKEYEYIREKMNHWESTKVRILTFTISGWIIALGIADKAAIPSYLVPIILLGIILIGIESIKATTDLHIRCYTYIRVFIEPKFNDLNWEEAHFLFRTINESSQGATTKFLKIIIGILRYWFTWLISATIYITVIQMLSILKEFRLWESCLYISAIGLGYIVVFYSIIQFIVALKYTEDKYIIKWKRIKEEISRN